ncbi:hypothetical protein RM863_35395 [Streptomyces sp. DSM 41014]|uniref:Uncharacterized protein n=1 Tax=Streptomyces hintoniae TaxID=3075521 RepID=A0ABU2UX29_9ACTN|nr:hypothetical protein [Streptomyces sp. DSM 41014]MDT0477421.1 hypothetical protein [Streptomyces sp. DSM 41014]
MPTLVTVHLRKGSVPAEVDLDTLTPKARALAEAIHMSFGHQPLGVLHATGRVKGDNPNFRRIHGSGPEADALALEPDHRFVTHYSLLRADSEVTPERWLEEQARSVPYDCWPIAGAKSSIEPLAEHVPSAEAARTDRCLTHDQARNYIADQGERSTVVSADAWIMLQKAGNAPAPRHWALGGQMPLWAVEELDAYVARDYERWPVSRVAEALGYNGASATGSARKQLSRWGLYPVGRETGRGGENLYAADQVQAAMAVRPGSGRHGAARKDGRFAPADKPVG